jgi:hypothetical protein
MPKRIHVIINPAAGQPEPILNKLNGVFHPQGVKWDASLTHDSSDASRLARQAAAENVDVVAALVIFFSLGALWVTSFPLFPKQNYTESEPAEVQTV